MASTSKTCSGSKQSATSSNTSTSVSTFDIFSGIVESSVSKLFNNHLPPKVRHNLFIKKILQIHQELPYTNSNRKNLMLQNLQVQESGKTRAVRKRKINETNEGAVKRIAHDVHNVPVIASPKNQSISNIPKSETSTHHVARSANLFKYIYEINCERVADNVNVSELVSLPALLEFVTFLSPFAVFQQKYLQEQLKVGGVKNNLAGNITIDCQGHKVSIKSKLYLPKKSLRFLSKKFLKKQWNIQVVSKSSHAYEFKYVGTP